MSKVEGNGQINKLMYIDYSSMGSNPKEVMDKYMKDIERVSKDMLSDMGYKGLDGKDMNKAIEKLFDDMSKKLGDGGMGSIMGDMGKNITRSNQILDQMAHMNDWSALTKMSDTQGLGGVSTTDDLAANVKQMMSASTMPSWAPKDSAMPAPGSNITDYSAMFDKMTKEMSEKNRQLAQGGKSAKDEKPSGSKDQKSPAAGSNPQYEALVKQAQKMVEKGDFTALMQQPVAGGQQPQGGTTAFSVSQMQMTDYQNAQNLYAQISQQMGGQQPQGSVTAFSAAQMQMGGQQPQAPAQGGATAFSVAQMQMTDYQNAQTIQSQMAAPASNLNTNIAAMFTTNAPGGPGYNPVMTPPAAQNTNIAAMFTTNVPGGPGYAPQAPQAPAGSGDIVSSFINTAPGGPAYAPQAPQAPAGSGDIAASFTANAPGGPGYAPMAPQAPQGSGDIVASFTANAPGGPGYAPMAPQAPQGSGNIVASFTANAPGGPGYAPMAPQAPQGSYDIAASFINPAPGGSVYAAAKPASAGGPVADTYANGVAGAQNMISTGNFAAVYDNSNGSSAHLTQSYNDFMVSYMASMGMSEDQVNSTMNYYFGSFDNSASALTGYNNNFAASLPNAHGNTLNPSGDQVKKA